MNVSKVPPGDRCESDKGSADGLGDGGSAGDASNNPDGDIGEVSDNADGLPGESDVGTGLLEKESRRLILSRIDSGLGFGIGDEAMARTRR